MGKTIRRKHVHHSLNFYRDNDDYTNDEANWKFHRDTKSGFGWKGHAPKSFNKMLNRIKRAKMKAEVRKMMNSGDFDSYSFDKWIHDGGWLYW